MSEPSESYSFDVLIVGAGPAGLTAAYRLSEKSSLSLCVLESSAKYLGGLSRTEEYRGFLFDIGGHRFFSKSLEIESLWREMLPEGFLERPRKSRILYRGTFYSYPLRAFEALINLGVLESVRCVLSYVIRRLAPVKAPRTFHQWVSNQFGERLYGIFFKTYTEKVWGMSCDELSADWAAQRIKGLSLLTAIVDAMARPFRLRAGASRHSNRVVKTLIDRFSYPERGPGMLWEGVGTTVRARGAKIVQGATAHRFVWDAAAGWWTVSYEDQTGNTRMVRAKWVVCSAPLRDVVSGVEPPAQSRALAASLRYRDFITVALILRDRGSLFDDNWVYVHDPGVKVGRIQNFRSWSPAMIPEDGFACLGLEYFCFEGDGLWSSSDSELLALARDELVRLRLARTEDVVDGYVVRQPKAYPVYDEGYRRVVDAIRTEFEVRFPTIYFVGRNGMHKYNNQDHAMMTALLAADNILAGERKFDVWAVNEDAEYHEQIGADRLAALSSLRQVPRPGGARGP